MPKLWVKGQSGNPKGKPKGTKNRETLLKEERRAMFDAEVSAMWKETIKKMRPEYIGDQFMGPATQKLDVTSKDEKIGTLLPEVLAEAEEILKKKKTEDE